MNSIMQEEKSCYFTGRENGLHKHHIFGGSRRFKSEEWGCWIWLYHKFHVGTSYAVHNNHELDMMLKRTCQARFEHLYGHDKFMEVFGKSWL